MSINNMFTSWIGKRIICNEAKNIKDIRWQAGIVRCTSSRNYSAKDFLALCVMWKAAQVCVEWDGKLWEQREWIHVHDTSILFIEKHLTLLPHPTNKLQSPALVFFPCKENILPPRHVLVEFFDDRHKYVRSVVSSKVQPFMLKLIVKFFDDGNMSESDDKKLKDWICLQKTQSLLTKGNTSLAGCRVLVYGLSALPWISAVVTKQLSDRQLNIMTEQVLTQTTVDPLTTQVLFLDPDVIGDIVGGRERRSRRSARTSVQDISAPNGQRPPIKENNGTDDKGFFGSCSSEPPSTLTESLRHNFEQQHCQESARLQLPHDDVSSNAVASSVFTSVTQKPTSSRQQLNFCSSSQASPITLRSSRLSPFVTSPCGTEIKSENMQQSQQQALSNLATQQALIQESQKHQNQSPQQRNIPHQPRIPSHLLTAPYINPYAAAGLQLIYNNQVAALAQAQLFAAAGGRAPQMGLPWLKQVQQGALEKDLQQQQLQQQQAIFNAIYGAKALEHTAYIRPESLLASAAASQSTSPRRDKSVSDATLNADHVRVNSPKELLAKKLSHHSASPSPLRHGEPPPGLHGFRQQASPRSDPPKPPQSNVDCGINQTELRRIEEERKRIREVEKEKEDSWKTKYCNSAGTKAEGEDVEGLRGSKDFGIHLSHNITQTPLGMIDPATLFAAHGAQQFIRDDTVRPNGLLEKGSTLDSPRPPFVTSSPSVAHSYKTWQPPVQITEVERGKSASPKATSLSISKTSPALIWSRTAATPVATSGVQTKPPTSSVFNIHALKYRPTTPTTKRGPSPKPEKVIVKTSPLPGVKEGQSIKYISDKPSLAHRPPQRIASPERLGPIMEDGSRARILSPESLKHLYRFPEPSSKTRASKPGTDSVIIKTGQYKVTEVHGGRESASSVQLDSSADHLVYAKHPTLTGPGLPTPPSSTPPGSVSEKLARKRAGEEDCAKGVKKARSISPPRDSLQSVRDVTSSSDPYLQGLAGAGMFDFSGSSIVWADSSKIGSEYPGAPTKGAIKGALLAFKTENGLNLSTSKPTTKAAPPPDTLSAPSLSEPISLMVSSIPKKRVLETNENSINSAEKLEQKFSDSVKQEIPTDMSTPKPLPDEINDLPPVSTTPSIQVVPSGPPEPAHVAQFSSKASPKPSYDDVVSKAAPCPKLKKAWIKRSYEADDRLKVSTSSSSDNSNPAAESSPNHERTESDSALELPKKVKKKHKNDKEKKGKDVPKKKRKHKEGKKGKKPNFPDEENEAKVRSNSKLFLLGKLVDDSEDGSDMDEGEEKKKRKDSVKMPLGENGLPISVLLCRKEQIRLKKSGESFVQDAACHEITSMSGISIQAGGSGGSALPKCRECRSAKRKDNNAIFCRFYGFRKLTFVNGHLQAAGFSDPEDSHASDLSLWLPNKDAGTLMELETCRYIMKHIGGKFCELVQDEREALQEAERIGGVRWKRPVHGVREMCDACETTLFNLHWVCRKCGFGICLDCYRTRADMNKEDMEAYDSDKNNLYRWLRCGKGKYHLPADLMPTQIIPSSCLFDLCELAHEVRAKWSVTSQCRCKKNVAAPSSLHSARANDPTPLLKNHCNSELLSQGGGKLAVPVKSADLKHPLNRDRLKGFDCENSASPLDWLASIALREQRKSSTSCATSAAKNNSGDEKGGKIAEKLPGKNGGLLPSSSAAPRSWLCNGQLLQLTDSSSTVNVDTFQLHWFYGMPVMASGASENLNRELWKPERFSEEHGDQPTGGALINCRKGSIITNALIKDFWVGFEKIENRLCDERTGEKLILKLKDWPTADDFIDTMPDKFEDLMRALPLPQYTARDGKFNMAACLPDYFVRPDLGPKMYIAYGWVTEKDWNQGTTNLHLDISDACNLMVYVGIPEDEPPEAQETLISIIREGDADDDQVERARSLKAGALWHIFKAADTDKIRKLILKVKAEKGIEVSDDHDPIHDQQIYLDKGLRRRLKEEYGVEGYPLVQCEGDSVFIPAGAPHQVFNLHSCIKVAEDFVSPEHVDKCFKLTEEFRHLSTTHSNHEDKLQLKNIIYHTMKEVVGAFNKHEADADVASVRSKPVTSAQT